MDFMAIASYGVYPTPTPTGSLRAALGVSYGLLDITLPGRVVKLYKMVRDVVRPIVSDVVYDVQSYTGEES